MDDGCHKCRVDVTFLSCFFYYNSRIKRIKLYMCALSFTLRRNLKRRNISQWTSKGRISRDEHNTRTHKKEGQQLLFVSRLVHLFMRGRVHRTRWGMCLINRQPNMHECNKEGVLKVPSAQIQGRPDCIYHFFVFFFPTHTGTQTQWRKGTTWLQS